MREMMFHFWETLLLFQHSPYPLRSGRQDRTNQKFTRNIPRSTAVRGSVATSGSGTDSRSGSGTGTKEESFLVSVLNVMTRSGWASIRVGRPNRTLLLYSWHWFNFFRRILSLFFAYHARATLRIRSCLDSVLLLSMGFYTLYSHW